MSKKINLLAFGVLISVTIHGILAMELEESSKTEEVQSSIYTATLSGLPDELKLEIILYYLICSPHFTNIKSVYDIDKSIKKRSLSQVSKEFKDLTLDTSVKTYLIKHFVQEYPQLAIDDLLKAISNEDLEMVQNLVKADVNVNGITETQYQNITGPVNKYRTTPLEYAINKPNLEIVAALLKAKLNPDFTANAAEFEPTPLHEIMNGIDLDDELRDKIALMLLQAGANPNHRAYDRNEPALWYAIDEKYYNIIEYLLDYGANPFLDIGFENIDNSYDEGDLLDIIKKSDENIKQLIENHPYDRLLLESVKHKDIETLKQLIEQPNFILPNFNINARNKLGYTALMIAVEDNDTEIVRYLLEHHANPNIAASEGETALSIARDNIGIIEEEEEDNDIITLLKKYGAE